MQACLIQSTLHVKPALCRIININLFVILTFDARAGFFEINKVYT